MPTRRAALCLALFIVGLLVVVPAAKADIFKIEGPGSCPGNAGGGLCNGSNPYSLTAFLNGSLTFSIANGTYEWVLKNDTGHTLTDFSFLFSGSQADNAHCEIANSHGATLTNSGNTCSIVDGLGHTNALSGPQIDHYFTPNAVISFGGLTIANGDSFNLDFVSMQGNTQAFNTPEPSSLLLLGAGLGGFAWKRRIRRG